MRNKNLILLILFIVFIHDAKNEVIKYKLYSEHYKFSSNLNSLGYDDGKL